MTDDIIRKLLAGFATNTLTETERQALFEAALEDQELFDALHHEEALKELLADPVSRAQIRQALEKPAPTAWWSRWWVWTGAMSAVAATVLIVTVTRSHTPESRQQYASVQAPEPAGGKPTEKSESDAKAVPQRAPAQIVQHALDSAAKQTVRARPSGYQNERKDELQSTTLPAPPPAPSAPPTPPALTESQQVQVEAQAPPPNAVPNEGRRGDTQAQSQQSAGQAVTTFREQQQSQASPAQFNGVVGGMISQSNFPPVRYTLLKRDADGTYQPLSPGAGLKPGDAVRLNVAPITSGYLSLSRQDASGEWKRVFPETGPGLAVAANVNYTIPASPIDVADADQNLRLTLAPTFMDKGDKVKARTSQLKKESTASMQLVVDLIVGPRRIP